MSGFAGGGGAVPPGPGGCAGYVYFGYVQMATLAEADARTVIGTTGCPLALGPNVMRLRVGVGAPQCIYFSSPSYGNNMPGTGSLDFQSTRTALNQIAYGDFATALGQGNRVDGDYGVGVGYQNYVGAGYTNATAIGQYNSVTGTYGVAIGFTNVVAGIYGVAIGQNCQANGWNSVAIGSTATADEASSIAIGQLANVAVGSYDGIAIGMTATVTAAESMAIGGFSEASGNTTNALGSGATARQPRTTNISCPIITRRHGAEAVAASDINFSGANVLIMFPEIDYNIVADYSLALFGGVGAASMWIEEVGLILTTLGAPVLIQPTVRFGTIALPGKFLAPTLCTLLTALRMRERFNLLLTDDPEVSLSFGITVAGTPGPATNYVRPYFRGHIVEDE